MPKQKYAPARTPQEKENQLISLAMNLAQKQLEDGTATSQVITHFLELATVRERLKNERLESDLRVAEAKIKQMEAQETSAELFEKAMRAFSSYQGDDSYDEDI